jgi:hypothetical protein
VRRNEIEGFAVCTITCFSDNRFRLLMGRRKLLRPREAEGGNAPAAAVPLRTGLMPWKTASTNHAARRSNSGSPQEDNDDTYAGQLLLMVARECEGQNPPLKCR